MIYNQISHHYQDEEFTMKNEICSFRDPFSANIYILMSTNTLIDKQWVFAEFAIPSGKLCEAPIFFFDE